MIPEGAKYQAHQIKLIWKDPNVGLEQVCLEDNASELEHNLFLVPVGGIWGEYGEWFFEKCAASLNNDKGVLSDMTELSEFQICDGIIEIRETDYGRPIENPSRYGVTYIDMVNLGNYCKNYELCQINKCDVSFAVFCFHIYSELR